MKISPRLLWSSALLLLTPALAAQELTWTGAVLGDLTTFNLAADPGDIFILGLSFNDGPTPIALVDPGDPRVLSLGLELLGIWPSGVLSPAGTAQVSFILPVDPSLQGLEVHSQFVTLFGAGSLVDVLSNPVSFHMQLVASSVATVGERPGTGTRHTQTALQDGRVLLAGGLDESSGTPVIVGASELYDPQTQIFVPGPPLLEARTDHTATALPDGRVLIAGGRGVGAALASCELFNPLTGVFEPTTPLPAPRSQHTATLLADGRVFVLGGLAVDNPAHDPVGTLLSAHLTTALFSPKTGLWLPGPSLPAGVIGHAATRIADGRVLVSGGVRLGQLFGFPTQTWTPGTWLFDPPTSSLLPAAPLPAARARHASLTPSADGRALVLGGEYIEPFFLKTYAADVWRYEADVNTWTVMPPLAHARGYHTAVEAGDKLVVAGGIASFDSMLLVETPELTAEVAPADVSAWELPIDLLAGRHRAAATAVDGGKRVLVTGGPVGVEVAEPSAESVVP
jgi:hypothetical protein